VQAKALVAVAPAVTGTRILLHDDRRHAELLQPRTENDAGLAAADHHSVGLLGETKRALFLLARLEPGLAILVRTVLDALDAVLSLLLFEALQLLQRGQQRPRLAADQAQVPAAAAGDGFEREPALGDAVGLAAFALDLELRRVCARRRCFEHRLDLLRAFGRLYVPGERHQVAPIRIVAEHRCSPAEIATRNRGAKIGQPLLNL
jgi:hypothetical protein